MLSRKGNIIILMLLQFALALPYLDSVPRVYLDEAWDSSLGYNLATTCSLRHPFIEGFGGIHIHFVQPRVILLLFTAAIFRVTEYSIAASRFGSVLFGVLAIASLYSVAHRWFGHKQAFFIGLATIIHPWFFEVSRRARPEIYYIGLGLFFLWLMTVFFDTGLRRTAFFAGVFACLAGLAHPTGLVLVFSISCAIIFCRKGRKLVRLIPWATIGFVMTALPYVIYVLWAVQNPQVDFIEQMRSNMLCKAFLGKEVSRWGSFLQWPKGAPFAVIMFVSWFFAWYRSSVADKILALIVAFFALLLPFTTITSTARYLIAITPFFAALITRLCWRIIVNQNAVWKSWHKTRLTAGIGVLVIYLSMCAVAITLLFYHLRKADFNNVVNRVTLTVGPENRICGDEIFWFGHRKYKYGPSLLPSEPITLEQAADWARKHNFDYAIRAAWIFDSSMGIDKPPQSMPAFRERYMFDCFCMLFGTKVDEFRDPYFGPIEIYKLNWNEYNWPQFFQAREQAMRQH